MSWIRLPNVSVTQGSKTVDVADVTTVGVKVGDSFFIPGNELIEITAVFSTQLELHTAWPGTTATGQASAAIPTAAEFNEATHILVDAANTLRSNFAAMDDWWTGTADVTFVGQDGVEHIVPPLSALTDYTTDLTEIRAAVVSTNADAVATAADVVSTNADAVATAADVASTNADVLATNDDAVATAADVVSTNADAVLAGNSETAAANSRDLAQEYAENPEDVPITGYPLERSAKSWAAKAKASAELIAKGVQFRGQWDASGGMFPAAPSNPTETVEYYRISGSGTMTGTGGQQSVQTVIGDLIYWDNVLGVWYEQESGDSIRTVNSKLPDLNGDVVLDHTDVGASSSTVSVERVTPTGPVDMTIGTTATRPDTSQAPYDTKALLWFNRTTGEYEAWNPFTQEWGAIGGGAGVPDPLIVSTDTAEVQLEMGNFVDLTNINNCTFTVPAMDVGDWFTVGDAYGLCSVYKPIVLKNVIWNGASTEDLVITSANVNIMMQKIDELGGLKVIDGIGEGGGSKTLLWAGSETVDGTNIPLNDDMSKYDCILIEGELLDSSGTGEGIDRGLVSQIFDTDSLLARGSVVIAQSTGAGGQTLAMGARDISGSSMTFSMRAVAPYSGAITRVVGINYSS